MDFVVIGLGLSALALLTGLTLLCMVAPRWSRKSSVAHPADAAYARALAGERHALGQGFLCVGAVLLLATLGGISAGLADKAGAYVIAAMTTVAVLGLFGWDLLYRRQHPVPQRRRAAPARENKATAEAALSHSAPLAASPAPTAVTARRRVLPARQRIALNPQPANAMVAEVDPVEIDIEQVDERPLGEALESDAAPLATAATATESGLENQDSAANPDVPGESVPAQPWEAGNPMSEELVSEEPVAGEPSGVAADLPEPVPFPPPHANGAADAATDAASGPDSDILLDGDDRVIALFPTAEARRSRLIAAQTDPDGKS